MSPESEDSTDAAIEDPLEEPGRARKPGGAREKPKHSEGYYLVRDIGVAILVVGIGFGGVVMYTQNWPPMVVIESDSMQHSETESYVGVIDTGDLVLVQKATAKADIETWVEGRNTGHQTYGDYGDVIIFHKTAMERGRLQSGTPIIHRAIIYLEWNPTRNGYDVPALTGAGNAGKWSCTGCNLTDGPYGMRTSLTLSGTSPRHNGNIILNLVNIRTLSEGWSSSGVPYSGYVTMGDHNVLRGSPPDNSAGPLWPQESIVGKARGEIPWFGLIKLSIPLFNQETSCCDHWGCTEGSSPSCDATRNSWDALVISIVVALSIPVFLDLTLGWWERRKNAAIPGDKASGSKDDADGKSGG